MSIISIIIPVYNEEKNINTLIDHLNKHAVDKNIEIIVVDGDRAGGTLNGITDLSVKRLTAKKGRAYQMNVGAAYAKGDILFFLHADSKLPENPFSSIIDALTDSKIKAGAFSLEIDSNNILLKIIGKTASMRSGITRIPYGDQGFFIRKKIFTEICGYSDIPIMEDIDLMQKLKKRNYRISILKKRLKTSPRRWEEQGIILCSLRNIIISSLFYLGKNAVSLKKYY